MCSNFNAILNLASSEDSMDIDPTPPPVRPQVLIHTPTTALFSQLRAALVQMDANNSTLFEALTLDQAQQDELIALLQEATVNVQAEQLQQNAVIEVLQEVTSNVEAEQLVQNSAIKVLQNGLLPRVHYEEEGLGGAHLLLTPDNGGDSSASLQTYDTSGNIGASIELQGNLITMSENVRILGDLLLGNSQNTVQAQLDDLEERILQEVIALSSNYALDFAQQALIAGLALLLKPKGYEALPDLPDDEDFPDSNSIPPIRCFPAGKFTDELPDELGNVVERINSKGKITVSADVLPTRTMTVGGDVIFLKEDEDDEFECQYTCRLGSKVAVLDELVLTNPQAVVCRLGTNALVQADGTVQAAAIVADKLNGIAPSRLLQRYPPSVDGQLNRRLAQQANRITSVARRAIKPVLAKSYDEDIARLHAELAPVRRHAYTKPAVLGRDWTDATVRLHDEVNSIKRAVHTVQLPSKDFSSDIADLKNSSNRGLKRTAVLPVRDYSESVKRLRTDLTDAMTNTGGLQSYTNVISTSNSTQLNVAGSAALTGNLSLTSSTNQRLIMGTASFSNEIDFGRAGLQLPTQGLLGTKLRLYGTPTTVETNTYSIGCSTGYMWQNAPAGVEHGLFVGGVQGLGVTANLVKAVNLQVGVASTLGSVSATSLTTSGLITAANLSVTGLSAADITVNSTISSNLVTTNTITVTGNSTLAALTTTSLTTSGLTTASNLSVSGTANISGDLNIGGTLNYISTDTILVTDKVVALASNVTSAALFNAGGITLGSGAAQATLLYNSTSDSWLSNKALSVTGKLLHTGNYAEIARTNAGNYIELISGPTGPTYIDFHSSANTTPVDFNGRIACYSDNQMCLYGSSFLFNNPLRFGQSTGQHINLFDSSYGLGVQSSTTFMRSDKNFAWYKGGVFNDGELNAGGGTTLMKLDNNGNLTVAGSVTGAIERNLYLPIDHYYFGLVGGRTGGTTYDHYLGHAFIATSTSYRLEFNVSVYVVDGSGTRDQDVMNIIPKLYGSITPTSGSPATAVGSNITSGNRFNRDVGAMQRVERTFTTVIGNPYYCFSREIYQVMNDNFQLWYNGGTLRTL
eukprot:2788-Heterococcus_DN1.PRE.4